MRSADNAQQTWQPQPPTEMVPKTPILETAWRHAWEENLANEHFWGSFWLSSGIEQWSPPEGDPRTPEDIAKATRIARNLTRFFNMHTWGWNEDESPIDCPADVREMLAKIPIEEQRDRLTEPDALGGLSIDDPKAGDASRFMVRVLTEWATERNRHRWN